MDTRSFSRRTEFRPSKALGQHFLVHGGIVQKILARSGFRGSDLVLEVGPGRGELTLPLSRIVHKIVAVEKDARLIGIIEKKLSNAGVQNVILVNEDILRFDFHTIELPSDKRLNVVGNLPYNISSPFLEKLIRHGDLLDRAVLMFQHEFAQRLLSSPGRTAYGALSVWVRYHAYPTLLLEVPRQAFSPRPRVDSMVLLLDFGRPFPRRTSQEMHFRRVVKGAFAHRRKTILNSLGISRSSYSRDKIIEALSKSGIDSTRRAETLCIDEFLDLAAALALTERPASAK